MWVTTEPPDMSKEGFLDTQPSKLFIESNKHLTATSRENSPKEHKPTESSHPMD